MTDIWSHCFSFLDLHDHISLSQCDKLRSVISKKPHSSTRDTISIENIKDRSGLIKFNPKQIEYRGRGVIMDLSPFTSLESLIIHDELKYSITALTRLTSVQYDSSEPLTNDQLQLLPTSLVRFECGYELYDDDLSLDHLSNLRTLLSYEINFDISNLQLDELNLEVFDPSMILPPLNKLILRTGSDIDWMSDFKYGGKELHLSITLGPGNLELFKNFQTDAHLTMDLYLHTPIDFPPNAIIKSLGVRCDTLDLESIMRLSSLDDLYIYLPKTIGVYIHCGKSQFHYWPKLKSMYLECDISWLQKLLNVLHHSHKRDNPHPCKRLSQKHYTISVTSGNPDQIYDKNMVDTFDIYGNQGTIYHPSVRL